MGVSLPISVLVVAFLAGCTSTVQVGLANAPLLINGGTPETRVHDVIANGHDACERNGFPPGEVLKGHIPPCIKKEKFAAVPDFRWNPPPAPPRHVPARRMPEPRAGTFQVGDGRRRRLPLRIVRRTRLQRTLVSAQNFSLKTD
jgi:hypothetical protein